MQSISGRFRFVGRHSINSSKIFAFKSIGGSPTSIGPGLSCSKSNCFASTGVATENSFGNSMGCWSRLLPKFASYSTLLSLKNTGIRTGLFTSSNNSAMPSVVLFDRGTMSGLYQLAAARPTFPIRCITTTGDLGKSASQDTSPSLSCDAPPPRLKFKRLDKTARHIMQILDKEAVEELRAEREIPDIKPGYIIQLKVEVPENKRRVSTIKGIVIARRNAGINTTFRLRRVVAGVGIEGLYPLYSPNIKEIKVLDKKKVRRAKLYYLRDRMNPLKK